MLYERDSNRKRDKLGVLRERERERDGLGDNECMRGRKHMGLVYVQRACV